jgi:hypothetical protein
MLLNKKNAITNMNNMTNDSIKRNLLESFIFIPLNNR